MTHKEITKRFYLKRKRFIEEAKKLNFRVVECGWSVELSDWGLQQ